jgi:hypothetical protein
VEFARKRIVGLVTGNVFVGKLDVVVEKPRKLLEQVARWRNAKK